jgi:hypothetical protein
VFPLNRSIWRELSFEAKSAFLVPVVILLAVAGFFAATRLAALVDPASDASNLRVQTLTVERMVTLTRRGERTVVRRVVKPAVVLGTAVERLTVTAPGRTERKIVPIVRRDLVTVAGQPRTIVETRSGTTRTSVVTSERVVTRERVVTFAQPVTTTRVVTENVSVTQTLRLTDTVHVTESSPPATVTVERPLTVTVTVTVTVPPGKTG